MQILGAIWFVLIVGPTSWLLADLIYDSENVSSKTWGAVPALAFAIFFLCLRHEKRLKIGWLYSAPVPPRPKKIIITPTKLLMMLPVGFYGWMIVTASAALTDRLLMHLSSSWHQLAMLYPVMATIFYLYARNDHLLERLGNWQPKPKSAPSPDATPASHFQPSEVVNFASRD
jgi:hypothetical protein